MCSDRNSSGEFGGRGRESLVGEARAGSTVFEDWRHLRRSGSSGCPAVSVG